MTHFYLCARCQKTCPGICSYGNDYIFIAGCMCPENMLVDSGQCVEKETCKCWDDEAKKPRDVSYIFHNYGTFRSSDSTDTFEVRFCFSPGEIYTLGMYDTNWVRFLFCLFQPFEKWGRGCEICKCLKNEVVCETNCTKPICPPVSQSSKTDAWPSF